MLATLSTNWYDGLACIADGLACRNLLYCTVKKSPAGMSLIKLFLAGKIDNLYYSVAVIYTDGTTPSNAVGGVVSESVCSYP